MQYSTFAAIDIGSYDVILEIFEISKKQGIRSVDKICHRMELGKDTYTLGKIRPEMEEELCRVLADFVRIMEGYRVDAYRAMASSAISEAANSLYVLGKIRQLTGLSVTVLSNSEQRFLGYKALAAMEDNFNKVIEKGTAILDLDGGSFQISLFDKDALVTTQNIRMGSLRVRERLAGIQSETEHYEEMVEELIWNEVSSFKKMYLKDRKIENIMLIGDVFTDSVYQNIEEKTTKIISRENFNTWYEKVTDGAGCQAWHPAGECFADVPVRRDLQMSDRHDGGRACMDPGRAYDARHRIRICGADETAKRKPQL